MRKILSGLVALSLSHAAMAVDATEKNMPISKVSTATKQTMMTPKQALQQLKAGNQRFLDGTMLSRNYRAQAKQSSYGQFPWAVVLNCMDSRSVPEFMFDQGLADLFTLRVAGNVLNDMNLGSMEFATKVVGARLIVVLGHTGCGAVSGACEGAELGHLDSILDQIKPSVAPAKKQTGLSSCSDPLLVNAIARENALAVARQIREQSPIISKLIDSGEVGIVAGMHDIRTGKVTFFEEGRLISR